MSRGSVVFCHGLHSGPWGTKIRSLAAVAEGLNFRVESADSRGLDDPGDRVERLVETASGLASPRVLVGSSLGAWVATAATARLDTSGLFLMAPAFHLPGLPVPEPEPRCRRILVAHGWRDEVVPVENALRFARRYEAETHLFRADHRLLEVLPRLEELMLSFLTPFGRDDLP